MNAALMHYIIIAVIPDVFVVFFNLTQMAMCCCLCLCLLFMISLHKTAFVHLLFVDKFDTCKTKLVVYISKVNKTE